MARRRARSPALSLGAAERELRSEGEGLRSVAPLVLFGRRPGLRRTNRAERQRRMTTPASSTMSKITVAHTPARPPAPPCVSETPAIRIMPSLAGGDGGSTGGGTGGQEGGG